MKFEWDENKNQINFESHGLSFQEAIQVFFDELRSVRYQMQINKPITKARPPLETQGRPL